MLLIFLKHINFNLGSSDDEKKRSSKELSSNNICKANGEKNETVHVCGYCKFFTETNQQQLIPVPFNDCQINCNYNEVRCMCGPKIPNFEFRNIRRPKRPNSENDQIRKAIIGNENDFSAENLRNFEAFNREIKKGPRSIVVNFRGRRQS